MLSFFPHLSVTRQRLLGMFLVALISIFLSQSINVSEIRANALSTFAVPYLNENNAKYGPIDVESPTFQYAFEVYTDLNWAGNRCYSDTPMTANIYSTCNDQISSIYLQSGWSARMYRDQNQGGPSVCINRTQSDLTLGTFDDGSPSNDAFSSFILYNQPWCGGTPVTTWPLEVYNDTNYSGTRCYSWDVLSADIHVLCNDLISSVLLRPGWSARFYRDPQQTGPSRCINGNDPDLTDNTFEDGSPMNDAISSHTVYHQSNCGGVYSITGRVTDSNGVALSGVNISDGAGHTATSNTNGDFSFSGLLSGAYALTPNKSGYSFAPVSTIVSVPPDATGENFVGTPLPFPSDIIVVESRNAEYSPSIGSTCTTGWYVSSYGGQDHGVLTLNASNASQSTNAAIWRPNMPRAGWYKVEAFIPYHPFFQWPCIDHRITSDTSNAIYEIHLATGTTTKVVNQAPLNNAWFDVGVYYFNAGTTGYVRLSDLTDEPFASHMVSFDDMRFTYLGNDCQPVTIFNRSSPHKVEVVKGGVCNQPTGSLGGTITDAQTGAKINAATVTLGGGPGINYVTQTDASGNYQWDFIVAGAYTIRVERDGYQPGVGAVQVPMNAARRFDTVMMPNRSNGYSYPIQRNPASVTKNAWYDTYFDPADRDDGRISSFNGIEGYNKYPGSTPGYVKDYNDQSGYWYDGTNWTIGKAYNRHDGTDYGLEGGVPILAAATGTVWSVGNLDTCDEYVILRHDDGSWTDYGHIKNSRKYGATIIGNTFARGAQLAESGDCQGHLHFSVKLNAYGLRYLWDGNSANSAPIVDPYTHNLWATTNNLNELSTPFTSSGTPHLLSNQLPYPTFNVMPAYAVGYNAQFAFDASRTFDSDGVVFDYIWDFGDGMLGNGITTTHVYTAPGTYYVSLRVYDNSGDAAYSGFQPIVIHSGYQLTKIDGSQSASALLTAQTITRSIKISNTLRAAFQFEWTNGVVEPVLVDPVGTVITTGTPLANIIYTTMDQSATYEIERPMPGVYTTRLASSNISSTTWVTSSAAVVDVHPPVVTQVNMQTTVIGGGTQITLTLDVTDVESLTGMIVRYNVDHGGWSNWQSFTPKVTFTVPETYVESTAIQIQDGSGNLSLTYGAGTIIHPAPPRNIFLPLILR